VWTFTLLRSLGQLDSWIALSYVVSHRRGGLMFWEGLGLPARKGGVVIPLRRWAATAGSTACRWKMFKPPDLSVGHPGRRRRPWSSAYRRGDGHRGGLFLIPI